MAEFKNNLITKPFRVAFPAIARKKKYEDKEYYGFTALFPKGAEGKAVKDELEAFCRHHIDIHKNSAGWTKDEKEKAIRNLFKNKDGDLYLFKDGDTKSYNGFAGNYAVTLKAPTRDQVSQAIVVYDKDKNVVSDASEIEALLYPGCYAVASLIPWVYTAGGKKGITVRVRQIMKYADGDTFIDGDFDDFELPDIQTSPFDDDE